MNKVLLISEKYEEIVEKKSSDFKLIGSLRMILN